ncbi:MAG: hypothetical protein LUC50_08955 [Ruminococcus sp.]|nr:hypothetical protein [Ruminococcus sp.]
MRLDEKVPFSSAEKEKAFHAIAVLYYDRNLGETTKSDFKTLLFSIYLEHLIQNNLPYDDYTMSVIL